MESIYLRKLEKREVDKNRDRLIELIKEFAKANDIPYNESVEELIVNVINEMSKATSTDLVNRVEVIDYLSGGRSYVSWSPDNAVETRIQDEGRTIKVFIS